MKIANYNDFLILEARKSKAEIETAVIEFIKKDSKVETGKGWPNEKSLYSLSTIIKALKDDFKSEQVANAITSCKEIKSINVKVPKYGSYPYYYIGLSESDAKEIKENYEKEVEGESKPTKKVVTKEVKKSPKKRVSPSSKSKIERKEK